MADQIVGGSASSSGDREGRARTAPLFEWIGSHLRLVLIVMAVVTVVAVPFAAQRQDAEEPNFDPSGEMYEIRDLSDDIFVSSSETIAVPFVVAAEDALSREVLLAFKRSSDELRSDPEARSHMDQQFAFDLEVDIDGVWSIADSVDAALPGGLDGATDAEVRRAVAEVLGEGTIGSPIRSTLSQDARPSEAAIGGETVTVWSASAFMARLLVDNGSFPEQEEIEFATMGLDAQEWTRDAQTVLKGDESTYEAWGVGFDADLTFEEQLAEASPFILFSIIAILILVGALLRSYWAAVLVALGLGVTMVWFGAVLEITGFKGGMLLSFVVPISTIAFGVDFFIHASGRAREEQVHGASRTRAYPRGLTAVFPALVLAVTSSMAAFISNSVSGIQAIVQFGLGAAIALFIAFATLSLVVPKALLAVESALGDPPADRGRMFGHKLGFLIMALVAGATVTMTVVMPVVGAGLLVVVALLFVYVPFRLTRRSYLRAAAQGRPISQEIKGAGHGFRAAGDLVHFLARWRVFTIPVTVVLAVLGLVGFTQVESEFTFSDFFNESSGFIQSIDLFEENFGSGGGGEDGYLFVEGDLTQPSVLTAFDEAFAELDTADGQGEPFLKRDIDGQLTTGDHPGTIVSAAVGSQAARQSIQEATGVAVTDDDGDGIADTSAQVQAIYDFAYAEGIPTDDGSLAFRAESVPEILHQEGDGGYATRLIVGIRTFTDEAVIADAEAALEEAASNLETGPAGAALTRVAVSGNTITQQDSLDAFTRSMVISLPVALILCGLIASLFMRSIVYGLASVLPILLVVGWIYGFMFIFDFKINVVTATIAAIAVGVGIDYSTHFTMRFREEFHGEPSRFPPLRRAGEGTGGALAISALSSVIGFTIMALAPMPIFATFGTLTAVMIVFSLLVALLVLPSLLLMVTFSRRGEEREKLIELLGMTAEEYDPHSRKTAERGRSAPV